MYTRGILLCLLSLLSTSALAQNEALIAEDLYAKGHGSVSLTLQMIEVSKFNNSIQDVDIGSVSTRSAYLELEYALAERWLLTVGVPYITKNYNGPARHNPLKLVPPRPEVAYLDDGQYHSSFQDFVIGIRYLLDTKPLLLEPFVVAYIPTHDYPHFAQAAVGQNLWKLEVGLEATHYLPFSDWYYSLAGSYTMVEETLGVNVNHFRLHGELGYFLQPDLSVNVFFLGKNGRGDDATAFPPSQRTDERWYQHDRTSRHAYLNVGLGGDWLFTENYQLTATAFTTVWGKTVHLVDWAAALEITRYF